MPVILLAIFIDLVGFGIIIPLLPFLTLQYGGDTFTGTAIISVYALAAFAVGPIWGRVSDRIGRKPTLAFTFLGAALAYLMLAFSTSLWMVFLSRAISGAMSGNIGIVMAVMADLTDEENRGKAMGRIGGAFGLGFAFGPVLGGYLSAIGGDSLVFFPGIAACALSLLALVLTAIFVPETNAEAVKRKQGVETVSPDNTETTPSNHWRDIVLAPSRFSLFVMFVVTAIAQSISFAIAPFWMNAVLGWTQSEVSLVLTGVGIIVFIFQVWLVGPLFRIIGEIRSLQFSAIFHVAGCLIILFGPPTTLTVAIGFPLVMSALSVAYPALNSLLSRRTDRRIQGAALGLSNGVSSLGRIAGPLGAGVLFSAAFPGLPFVFVTLLGIVVFGWAWWEDLKRPYRRKALPPQ